MTYICPFCRKQNKVAGWMGWQYAQDGKQREAVLHCWSCHKRVTQEQLEGKKEKEKE